MNKDQRFGSALAGTNRGRDFAIARLITHLLASTALFLLGEASLSGAMADCSPAPEKRKTTVCDGSRDQTKTLGTGPGLDNASVIVRSGSLVSTDNSNAISLGDGASITVEGSRGTEKDSGATVENAATISEGGNYGSGRNTIEFGSDGILKVEKGGRVLSNGSSRIAEAVNVHGSNNRITNRGLIESQSGAAIWFEDWEVGAPNIVDNYGTIRAVKGGNVIGNSGGGDVNFINRTGARVEGSFSFAGGDDTLTLEANSVITGHFDGGKGDNSLILDGAPGSADTLPGNLSNFKSLLKSGEGKWTLSGSIKNTGHSPITVTVEEGTLALTGKNENLKGTVTVNKLGILEARAQSLPPTLTDNGLVRFAQPDDGTYTGLISGKGGLEKTGAGVLTLSPEAGNSFTGGTKISDGTIAIAEDKALGNAAGKLIFDGGALQFNSGFDLSKSRAITLEKAGGTINTNGFNTAISQEIAGEGDLKKAGAGALVLTGQNSYAGQTTVAAGTLYIDGDQSKATGTTTIAPNATLGGIGAVGGSVKVESEGILAPGDKDSPGTLTINKDLTLAEKAILDYRFGEANVAGGTLNDLTEVKGNLVLDGTLNVVTSEGGRFDPGIYRVINYAGALTNNGLDIGKIPSSGFYVQTSVDGQVNLVNTDGLFLNYWDGPEETKNNSVIKGGDGVWQNFAGNDDWTEHKGAINAPFQDASFAIFSAQAGVVTVDNSLGKVNVSGMQFSSDGYAIDGDPVTLVGAPDTIVRVGDGTAAGSNYTATVTAELTGNSQLVKTDLGKLVLKATNTYTGGTTIREGTIEIASDSNLGDASGGLDFANGTLHTTADITTSRPITTTGTATLFTDADTTLTLKGAISGSGDIVKDGAGKALVVGGATNSGKTDVKGGTLTAGGENMFSSASAHSVLADGTLDLAGRDQTIQSLDNGGLVVAGGKPGTVLTISGNYTGRGGTIALNTTLNDDLSPTDLVRVGGDTSGSSLLKITNINGKGAPTTNGIKVIDVAGASDAVFALTGDYLFKGQPAMVAGAYSYRLFKNGVTTPSDGDWYLRSSTTAPDPKPEKPDVEVPRQPDVKVPRQPDIEVPRQPDVEVPRQPDVEVPRQPNVDVQDQPDVEIPRQPDVKVPRQPDVEVPRQPNVDVQDQPNVEVQDQPQPQPLYQPGVPLYETYAQTLLALIRLPTLQQRVGNRYWSGAGNAAGDESGAAEPEPVPSEGVTARIDQRAWWARI